MIADILQRVSSKKQIEDEKTGLQRQDESITKWLKQNPDCTVRNEIVLKGQSAFNGKHVENTLKLITVKHGEEVDINPKNLKDFDQHLVNIYYGRIQAPDFLIVDEFSRLSRLKPSESNDLLRWIARMGISIVIAQENKVYSPEAHDQFEDVMILHLRIKVAHDESQRKSIMIRAAKKSRRDKAIKEGGILKFGNMPKWLEIQNDQYILIPHRADAIRFMFDCVVSGMSKGATARELNNKGFNGWDRKGKDTVGTWDATKVARIIDSKSVTGTHVSRTWTQDTERSSSYMGKVESNEKGLEIHNIYPRIVSDEVFNNAQLKKANAISRTKNTRKTRNDGTCIVSNAVCSMCGSSMLYKHASRGSRYSEFLCSNRKYGGSCSNSSINYKIAEKAVLTLLFEYVNLSHLFESDDSSDFLKAQLAALQDEIDALQARIKEKKGKVSSSVVLLLDDKETELEEVKQQLQGKQEQDFTEVIRTWKEIENGEPQQRVKCAELIEVVTDKIEVESIPRGKKVIRVYGEFGCVFTIIEGKNINYFRGIW
ncbi:TPA: recombinase family protein [Vibrio harveyi]|uniref:recombinase family protein n=1 Tax=Vibrio harveyi TaxID=669 RepID=UPI00390C2B5F